MAPDRTSFYRIIFHVIGSDVMSLDQKRHSIGPAAFLKKSLFLRVLLQIRINKYGGSHAG